MKNEAHIPTQQTEAEKKTWLSGPDEDRRGAQGDQTPPPAGSKETGRLKFPKSLRLRRRREFVRLQKSGQRLVGQFICIDYRRSPGARLGITASTRYGNSPERNRFKRLVREAFRTSLQELPPNVDLNVVPRQKAKRANLGCIRSELVFLLNEMYAKSQPR